MRWSSALVTAVVLFSFTSPSATEKRISIYSTGANYSLPVLDREGREYVGLLEILEPLGKVSSRTSGTRWKIRYNDIEGDFLSGKSRGRVRGKEVELGAPLLLENNRGLVPVSVLGTLLPKFLGGPVTLHEKARRLFIGSAMTQFTTDLVKANPSRLVLNFTAPVNPTISTEPGRLRMLFSRDPVLAPASPDIRFDDSSITSLSYSEGNGTAELVVNGTVSLMASFSSGGRTITVTSLPRAPGQMSPNIQIQPPVISAPGARAPAPQTAPNPIPARQYSVVIDASHGGTERGAALTEQLAEKDVTLAFAGLLKRELESRGVSLLMVRDGDSTIGLDDRAALANSTRAAVYISVHATSVGASTHVYSSLLPPAGSNQGAFLDWNTAQSGSLPLSQALAATMASTLQQHNLSAQALSASLRPLNNITIPAIAVELAPPPSGVADVNSLSYQRPIAATLADVIAAQVRRTGTPQ